MLNFEYWEKILEKVNNFRKIDIIFIKGNINGNYIFGGITCSREINIYY